MALLKHLYNLICAVSWLVLCLLYTIKALLSPAVKFSKSPSSSPSSSLSSSFLIMLYTRFNGGYQYLEEEFQGISSKAQSLDPHHPWSALPHFRLLLDDQANKPYELCRSCIGWIISSKNNSENSISGYVDEVKAKWESHPLVVQEGYKIGAIHFNGEGGCMSTARMPCYGPLAHLVCFIKAYIALLKMTSSTFTFTTTRRRRRSDSSGSRRSVLGLLELHLPTEKQVVYILPPGSITDL